MSKQCTTHHFACDCREEKFKEMERENAALRDLASRMATEMREVDHEFASLRDYDAGRKEAQP